MKIIIVGAGRVGTSVAEALVSEANDITVIDTDGARVAELQNRFDLRGLVGNAALPSTLAAGGARYNAAAKFYQVYSDSTETVPDVRISHVGYDRIHTTAEDPRTWFPLEALHSAVKRGQLGALTPRFHGAPTNRSQRVTVETDAPELLRRCREDGAEAALLVPS